MSGIKETPTNFRVYYTSMKNAYTQKKEEAVERLKTLGEELNNLYNLVSNDFKNNADTFIIDLNNYDEYKENKYISGNFLRVAKGILINRKDNYELVGRNLDIYNLAKTQKDIYDISNNITLYDKLLALSLKEYNHMLKTFYTKVQEKMIIDGCGYAFDGNIGWICINRCKVSKIKPRIDYSATKKRKAELMAEGKRLYNKEEADWCKENGIEYKAEDGRVFQRIEYLYEIPLIGCKLEHSRKIKFQTVDYRGRSVRSKTNADILRESNGDKHKICSYDLDMRTKLYICLEADKILYSKFIRNENQEASTVRTSDRKD